MEYCSKIKKMEANRRLLDELMGTNRNGDEKPRDVTVIIEMCNKV